jgi:hypothetical protein
MAKFTFGMGKHMSSLRKISLMVAVAALAVSMPVSAANGGVTAPSQMGVAAVQVVSWISSGLWSRFENTATKRSGAAQVTIDGNHMIVEAKRLTAEVVAFSGLSGPRKKQSPF